MTGTNECDICKMSDKAVMIRQYKLQAIAKVLPPHQNSKQQREVTSRTQPWPCRQRNLISMTPTPFALLPVSGLHTAPFSSCEIVSDSRWYRFSSTVNGVRRYKFDSLTILVFGESVLDTDYNY